ncbi:MAG: flagellar filament capping protein FliD [Phycisphaeraceae bacterium]
MSGITTGTGLVSGMDIQGLVDQLMAVEARPRKQVEQRNELLNSQQVAYQEINAKLLALKMSAETLTKSATFKSTSAASSNESVLTASSGADAVPGNYAFTVDQLVAAQQTITRGFRDADTTAIGAGTLSFERADAKLSATTQLASLNGGAGVERGQIRITDGSGAAATVDLSRAMSVDDVLEAINSASGVSVTASVEGDRLKLTDDSGQTLQALSVADLGSTSTAADLGLAGSGSDGELVGSQVNHIGEASQLSELNDGKGIHRTAGNDLAITTAAGDSFKVDLSSAATLGDAMEAIETATGGAVTAAVGADGVSLELTDTTGGGAGFSVAAVSDSRAAADLGLLGSDDDADGKLGGKRLLATINSKMLSGLRGGQGVTAGTIEITNAAGTATQVDLSTASSVDDVLRLINESGAGVTASLNNVGHGIAISDASGGTGDLVIADVSGSAAAELGLAGTFSEGSADSGDLDFQYVTENTRLDELGVTRGKFTITDSAGDSATVDLTQGNEVALSDVISEINSRGLAITARINDTGDGILIEDTGPGTNAIRVEEAGSTTAADLGILGEAASPGAALDGRLERTVDIDPGDTLEDVAQKINDAKLGVNASILNDGSGSSPHRLILSADDPGSDGAFLFDDGGLGLGGSVLSEARDAVAFFGSSDPARALAVTSSSNTLEDVIPGTEVQLKATSQTPVQVTINRDTSKMTKAIEGFVEKFNGVTKSLDEYDSYDAETKERGLLLGDSTVGSLRRRLFSEISGQSNDLEGQFRSLAQVGITVGRGASLEFDEERLAEAVATDSEAVRQLFTFKKTEENAEGEDEIVASGVGVGIAELLKRLTDVETGPVQSRIEALGKQIELNKGRIEDINDRLKAKRERLLNEFYAMEESLAKMQSQSEALANFKPISPSSGGGLNKLMQGL